MTQSMFESKSRREGEPRVDADEQRERAERAARDAERDTASERSTAADREQLERDAQRGEWANEPAPPAFGTSYLDEGTEVAWQRWHELQSAFVDDPQNAVRQADGLVTELIDGIIRRFETEREQLERRWSSGQEVSTEDLRRCLQRYRDFFGRLLENVDQRVPAE